MTNAQSARSASVVTLRPRGTAYLLRVVAGLAIVVSSAMVAHSAGAVKPANIAINESNNGKIVVVKTGSHVTLTLHSTYWTIAALPRQTTLTRDSPVVTTPRLPASANGCVPGQGCGTVTVHFLATGPGQVRIRASRTSCGEAMRCTPQQSVWTVVIRVR